MKVFTTCLFLIIATVVFSQTQYIDQADELGVNHSYGIGFAGGGVSLADINNDGWDDLTLATQEGDNVQIYLNDNGSFILQTDLIINTDQSKQILWVDFDNDGDKDLFLATFDGINRLYENDGNLNLTDITLQSGLIYFPTPTYGASFGDYDRDGFLDLYYGNKTNSFPTNRCFLFHNNGDGTFSEQGLDIGLHDSGKAAFCSAFFDLDNNRWQDIYTANDKTTINSVFYNNGDGSFSDIGESSNGAQSMNAMCVAVGDYDNNGFLDIYVSNTPEGNALLQNNGDHTFNEVAEASGTLFEGIGWASNFFDANNDGDLDLYVSAMVLSDSSQTSLFYDNNNDGTFSTPDAGFENDTATVYCNAIGDINQDGYPDILTNTANAPSKIWMNQGGNHHWLKIKLEGVVSNKDGIGTMIECYVNGSKQIRYTHCGIGYLGQNSETELFGLADEIMVDSIVIKWLSGHNDVLYDLPVNEIYTVIEGSTTDGEIYIDPDIGEITIATNEIQAQSSWKIYPNPSQESIFFESDHLATEQTTIKNIQGQTMPCPASDIDNKRHFNIQNLPAGIFFIEIKNDGKIYTIPFVKR